MAASSLAPRVVLVTRLSPFQQLIARHATRRQVEFFLAQRGQSVTALERQNLGLERALATIKSAIPDDWTVAQVLRDDLDRFLFTERDIIVAVGQDGLIANLAKYVNGQTVIGVTPSPGESENILTTLAPESLKALLPRVAAQDVALQRRTMIQACLDDGQTLTALNEIFVGHRSHQSARYTLTYGGAEEAQSSSGVIVSTGTGLTGWARSILQATQRKASLEPEAREALYFTREPWPSKATGCALTYGAVDGARALALTSRMDEGGVIFADGLEQDYLRFDWGACAAVSLADKTLNMVQGG